MQQKGFFKTHCEYRGLCYDIGHSEALSAYGILLSLVIGSDVEI